MDEFLDWTEVLGMEVKQEFQQLGRNYQDGFQPSSLAIAKLSPSVGD